MAAEIEANPETKQTDIISALTAEGFTFIGENLLDDAENIVEVQGTVTVKNTEEASKVVKIASAHGFGVMPIASLTSATGVFKGGGLSDRKGWIGLKINPRKGELPELETRTDIEGQVFEIIPILDGRARIFRSNDPDEIPHRVQTWAGVTPSELDSALKEHLGRGHTIHIDLTTRDSAQIGAVISTGGQGPTRADATLNLLDITVVDHSGEIHQLSGARAKLQVGLCGLAGAITEANFEVVREEPYELGLFIPLQGELKEALTQGFPTLMSRLARFTKKENGPVRIKGFEIVTRGDLSKIYDLIQGEQGTRGRGAGCIGSMHEFMYKNSCEVGLMINCRTSLPREQLEQYLVRLLTDTDDSNGNPDFIAALKELIDEEVIHPEIKEHLTPFFDEHMPEFRQAREGVADVARASKKRGPTKSTDINLQITTEDPEEIKKAYEEIWRIYYEYIKHGKSRNAEVFIYGHNHPGCDTGGGVNAHIRITFPLKEQDHQKRAAENIALLEQRQRQLVRELIALNGQHGIKIKPGEKGLILSPEYTAWLEENEPNQAEMIWKYMQVMGGETFASRNNIFRLHAYPPRIKEGILNYFAADPEVDPNCPILRRLSQSILLWCQNSHRGAEGQKVFGETLGLIRDWLKLKFSERVFFTESPEKALISCILSLNDYREGREVLDLRQNANIPANLENTDVVIVNNPAQLDDERFKDCKKILVTENSEPVGEEIRQKADAVIYNAESFGAGAEMGIIVTNTNTIKHARRLHKKGNNTGYVHSLIEMNAMPHSSIETPKMQIIAELGCSLAEKLGQRRDDKAEYDKKRLHEQTEFRTLNPGPSQIHSDVIKRGYQYSTEANAIKDSPDLCKARVNKIKEQLREFLGIPADYEIFFSGSATQAMEQTVESLMPDHSIVINNGAFADRQQKVVQTFSRPRAAVRPVQMRWGTGPNSRLDPTIGEIKTNQPMTLKGISCGLFMTGHETSTGVEMDVSAVAKALHPDILKIVDGTSEIGAIPRNFRDIDVYFASFQKFFGLPSGLSVIIASPRAIQRCREADALRNIAKNEADDLRKKAEHETEERKKEKLKVREREKRFHPSYRTFTEMIAESEAGKFHNLRGILQLETVLDDFLACGGIIAITEETRAKMNTLLKMLEPTEIDGRSGRLFEHAVVSPEDRSRVLLHAVPIGRDPKDIRRRLKPFEIGGGYGPYANETLRFYASPHVSIRRIQKITDATIRATKEAVETNGKPLISRGL